MSFLSLANTCPRPRGHLSRGKLLFDLTLCGETIIAYIPCGFIGLCTTFQILIHFDWHSHSAEDYKVYPLHCYLLFFSAAFWLSRTLCFFKEVKASLRMLWERKCAWLLMIDNSFSLRIMIILYITTFVVISVRRQSASITVRIVAQRNVLSAQKIAWMYCRVTVGYCFLLAPKWRRFSLLLTCWIVTVVFRGVRKPVTPTKYVAHCWLWLVRSVNS